MPASGFAVRAYDGNTGDLRGRRQRAEHALVEHRRILQILDPGDQPACLFAHRLQARLQALFHAVDQCLGLAGP